MQPLRIHTESQEHQRRPSEASTASSLDGDSPGLHQYAFSSPYDTRSHHGKFSRSSSISSIMTTPDSGVGADRRCRSRASSTAGLPYSLPRAASSADSFHSTDDEWGGSNTSDWSLPSARGGWESHLGFATLPLPLPSTDSRRPSDAGISYGVQNMGLSDQEQAREDVLNNLADMVKSAPSTSAGDKARASFVHAWLSHSYTIHQDGNVSRQAFYGSYMRVCERFSVRGVNAASFGKAVRAAFPQVKTRRLGVRGNSKYHYCGIRPSTLAEAAILAELTNADNHSHANQGSPPDNSRRQSTSDSPPMPASPEKLNLPNEFPSLIELLAVDGRFAEESWKYVWSEYSKYCSAMLDAAEHGQVERFDGTIQNYYASPHWTPELRAIVEDPVMACVMFKSDSSTYDACLGLLMNRELEIMDPNQFVSLRQLGDQLEQSFCDATQEFSQAYTSPKVELVARFGHLMTRIVGICQLAQALKGPGFQGKGREEMVEAWDSIDFETIRNHCALATNCHQEHLSHCLSEFSKLLKSEEQFHPKNIGLFLDAMVRNFLEPDSNGEPLLAPRSLLGRVAFVISQLMRDLTLRSDKAFGSFQLLALFCEDYLGLSILRQVALPPSAVTASVAAVQQPLTASMGMSPIVAQSHFGSMQPHHFGGQQPSFVEHEFQHSGIDLPGPAQDFPLDFAIHASSSFNDPMGPQYATFSDFSFPTSARGSSVFTPLASFHNGGDMTAKAHEFGLHSDWPSSLVPQTPLSPSFLLATSH